MFRLLNSAYPLEDFFIPLAHGSILTFISATDEKNLWFQPPFVLAFARQLRDLGAHRYTTSILDSLASLLPTRPWTS